MFNQPDLAAVAALIAEPTRAAILSALLGGEALPASELAYRAQVTPQTASAHLAKLLEGGLVKVTSIGRHRYYSLKNHDVAHVLEAMALVAPLSQPHPPRPTKISPALCGARTCYDHLAGKLGVAFTETLVERGLLVAEDETYTPTPAGLEQFAAWKIDVDALKRKRRKLAYVCLDWSERRFHLAGTLGAAIADVFFTNGWVRRIPQTRALEITTAGAQMLKQDFGIVLGQAE